MIFNSANILLPKNIDLTAWSVVACDQYTSEKEYWSEVEKNVGDKPSTLNIIFPEIYLNDGKADERILNINKKMLEYINSDMFNEYKDSLILVERKQRDGKNRFGIVGTIDLEEYDFSVGSCSAVRATEKTVVERIPPRVQIRQGAALELPHILMLIDDKERTVIEPIRDKREDLEKIYDFELQMNSGHLNGYLINGEKKEKVLNSISKLTDSEVYEKAYGGKGKALKFAVGDGNHSLATAKTCWENIKKNLNKEEIEKHPARFALVELMNVHDDALVFEPIHRVVFDAEPEKMLNALKEYYKDWSYEDNGGHKIEYCYGTEKGTIYIKNSGANLPTGTITAFIDDYLSKNNGTVDYIHGEDVVKALSSKSNSIGFIVPAMAKSELFETVIKDGSLPRKTFSMGEANDKRFYIECKSIQK